MLCLVRFRPYWPTLKIDCSVSRHDRIGILGNIPRTSSKHCQSLRHEWKVLTDKRLTATNRRLEKTLNEVHRILFLPASEYLSRCRVNRLTRVNKSVFPLESSTSCHWNCTKPGTKSGTTTRSPTPNDNVKTAIKKLTAIICYDTSKMSSSSGIGLLSLTQLSRHSRGVGEDLWKCG